MAIGPLQLDTCVEMAAPASVVQNAKPATTTVPSDNGSTSGRTCADDLGDLMQPHSENDSCGDA